MDWLYPLIPILLQLFGAKLIAKDKNDEGADDEIGKIMVNIAPLTTDLVANKAPKQALLDAVFVALYNQVTNYLIKRKILPAGVAVPLPPSTQ